MQKINILYIIPFLAHGGTEKQLMMLVNGLNRERFNPCVVALYGDVGEYRDHVACDIIGLTMTSILSWDGVQKIKELCRIAREREIDIVQAYFLDPTFMGLMLKLFAKVKTLITCRRDLGFWYTPWNLCVLRVLNFFTDRILVNSHAVKTVVREKEWASVHKVSVVHNGVNIVSKTDCNACRRDKRKELGIDDSHSIVGILGNFNRSVKRHDLFIDAAARVLQQSGNVLFCLIGFGNLKNELEAQIKKYGIEKQVIFLGCKDEPFPYVCAFDVGVNASDSEGFSNAVIEYMACGVPVVATDNPGNAALITHDQNGILVPVGDAESLANGIIRILTDKEKTTTLKTNAQTYVEANLSVSRMVEWHEAFYGG